MPSRPLCRQTSTKAFLLYFPRSPLKIQRSAKFSSMAHIQAVMSSPDVKMLSKRPLLRPATACGANITSGCASKDDLYSYKAHRWLWNECEQLQRRYLKIDINALVGVVKTVSGTNATCTEVTRLPSGNFNKTFAMILQDGCELIARLPNPNAGPRHYTTASEAVTMDYVYLPHWRTIPCLRVKADPVGPGPRPPDPRTCHAGVQYPEGNQWRWSWVHHYGEMSWNWTRLRMWRSSWETKHGGR